MLWEALQLIGGAYIDHIAQRIELERLRTFAVVLGVLAWLHIGAQMLVFCAELNTVIADELWPKPLFGDSEQTKTWCREPGSGTSAVAGRS